MASTRSSKEEIMNITPRFLFNFLGRVYGFGFEFSSDGIWGTKCYDEPYHYSYTDFIAFGIVKRKGDEDIHILRFVLGPFQFAFVFTDRVNPYAVGQDQEESQATDMRQPQEEGEEAERQVAATSRQSGD